MTVIKGKAKTYYVTGSPVQKYGALVSSRFEVKQILKVTQLTVKKTQLHLRNNFIAVQHKVLLLFPTYHIVVISEYPTIALHDIARMWLRTSILSSVHQASLLSGSSWLVTRSKSFTERDVTVPPEHTTSVA